MKNAKTILLMMMCLMMLRPLSMMLGCVSHPKEAITADPVVMVYPLKSGPPGAGYLVDQGGTPFPWVGDTAWSGIAQWSQADVQTYLTDRAAKGFNVVVMNLIEHHFATNAPANFAGDAPFACLPFTSPNEAYFAHADAVIDAAATRGLVVVLDPLYLGYQCGNEGWCAEARVASDADLVGWGRYVGARYAGRDNIVWMVGGDVDPVAAGVSNKVLDVVSGIQATDARHLITAHNNQDQTSLTPWPGQTWIGLNGVYSYSATMYQPIAAARAASTVPVFLLESAYDNERSSTPQSLRAQAWWTFTSGGMGMTYGDCPVWNGGFAPTWCNNTTLTWQQGLATPGAASMTYVRQLLDERPWHLLAPAGHAVVTSGWGTNGGTDYVTDALASDGSWAMAYLPSSRTVTVNASVVASGTASVYWYWPATGQSSSLGDFSGSLQLTPPQNGDWVLVLDDAARGWPPPGPLVLPPAPDAGVDAAVDAAVIDAGVADASPPDAAPADASPPDASPPDASPPDASVPADTILNFESLSDNAVLTTYGGITWQGSSSWKVWDATQWGYTKNAFINSTSKTAVSKTFTLPAGKVLKSIKVAVGSGGTGTIKFASTGNTTQTYSINGAYQTFSLGWATAAAVVTVTITCNTTDGASDPALDDLTYGVP